MGTYLHIGLVNRLTVGKSAFEKTKITQETLAARLGSDVPLDLSLYELTDETKYMAWELKPAMVAEQLIPFLEAFYPIYYKQDAGDSDIALKTLRTTPPETWAALAKDKRFEAFQENKYTDGIRIYFEDQPLNQH